MNDFDCAAYRDHLRPHTPEERAKLEASLLAEGCRDPLVVGVLDGGRYLIDGFHRKDVCDANSLPYEVREVAFESSDDLLRWVETNGRARRNQTRTERLYYLGRRYNRERGSHGGDNGFKRAAKNPSGQVVHSDLTSQRIAREEQLNEKTVRRAGKFAAALDELCELGWGFLKWPILSDRVRATAKLFDRLADVRAADRRAAVEALLAEFDPDKPIPAAKVLEAAGVEDELKKFNIIEERATIRKWLESRAKSWPKAVRQHFAKVVGEALEHMEADDDL